MTDDRKSSGAAAGERKGGRIKSGRTLERIHAQGDRSARRGLIILALVLISVLVLVFVVLRSGRDPGAESESAKSKTQGITPEAEGPPAPERFKLGLLVSAEGEIVWPTAPDKTRSAGDEIWDGEGIATRENGGGSLRLIEGGGLVDFGPGTILHFAGGRSGDDQVLGFGAGLASFSFGAKGGRGRCEIEGFGSFSPTAGLRLVVHAAPPRPDGHRVLYLHTRRGQGSLDLPGFVLELRAGCSEVIVMEGQGAASRLSTRVSCGQGGAGPAVVVIEGDRRVELEALHQNQALQPESRLLARTLVDQSRALADGERVTVDMFDYLNEQGLIAGDLRLVGGRAGDIDADVRLLRGDEVLAGGPLASIIAKGLPGDDARFDRLIDAWLLPVSEGDEKDTLLLFELKSEALERFAHVPVELPESLEGRKILVRPNLTGHAHLFLRAIAVASGHKLVESGDYGVAFVPSSD